ncbi:hypothetical protein [Micromonospora sp. NPDC051296]|uniref:hypothetical protein n=1 Tax=Micromonospora sp. NPDC051296 TaxID=3155046 RepID=UPI0034489B48
MIDFAVRENAAWCDLVCRTHGQPGSVDADTWSVPRRSPPWYPDAVTLQGTDLTIARRYGFRAVGPLRVWAR